MTVATGGDTVTYSGPSGGNHTAQGVVVMQPGTTWAYAGVTGGITDTSDVVLIAAGGVGVRNYLYSLQYNNSSAVASELVVKDGSTVIARLYTKAAMAIGGVVTFNPPLRGSSNTAMSVAMVTTGTATIVSAQGSQGA